MNLTHEHVRVAITPGASDPTQCVAIMHYTTQGRGDSLPAGATWIDEAGQATDDPRTGTWRRPATDALIFAAIMRSFNGTGRPAPAGYRILADDAVIPEDRTYRGAWMHDGKGAIVHDMARAKAIHQDRLREARAPQLAALDTAYLRADESGDNKAKAEIAKQKQALRDITSSPQIDAAKTVDELKAIQLGVL